MNLSFLNITIVFIYIVLIFYAGTIVNKYIKNIDSFLVDGRSMGFHLGLLSLMCTEIGMITFIYYAQMGYDTGFSALIVAIPPVIGYIFLGKTRIYYQTGVLNL